MDHTIIVIEVPSHDGSETSSTGIVFYLTTFTATLSMVLGLVAVLY